MQVISRKVCYDSLQSILNKLVYILRNVYICKELKNNTMTYSEIKQAVLNGEHFGNESAEWCTVAKPTDTNRGIISINGEWRYYESLRSYCIRIKQLINRGY